MLTAVIAGGAKVVGFDIVFPTSIEQSEIAFDDGKLGARLRGFDRDFLRALALGAHDGKVVLGEAQHCDLPILPSPGQRIAVGQSANIRSLNVYNDPDDVVRRIPLSVMVDGNPQWSIVVELTSRALGSAPETAADGTVTLSGYRIPTLVPNTMTLNFGAGPDPIPTYSLADLRACIDKGDSDFFRRNFADKVVLIATVLDVEDRQVTSKRFATSPENPTGLRCALPAPPPSMAFARDSTPGVYTHATAINNLMRGDAGRTRPNGPRRDRLCLRRDYSRRNAGAAASCRSACLSGRGSVVDVRRRAGFHLFAVGATADRAFARGRRQPWRDDRLPVFGR